MTSAKHKNPPAKPKEKYSVQQALTNYYLLIMFTLFPLFFTDAYFNIRHDKYYFFIILTGILVIAEFLIIMTASVDKPPEDTKLEKPKPKHLYEELSFMDSFQRCCLQTLWMHLWVLRDETTVLCLWHFTPQHIL